MRVVLPTVCGNSLIGNPAACSVMIDRCAYHGSTTISVILFTGSPGIPRPRVCRRRLGDQTRRSRGGGGHVDCRGRNQAGVAQDLAAVAREPAGFGRHGRVASPRAAQSRNVGERAEKADGLCSCISRAIPF